MRHSGLPKKVLVADKSSFIVRMLEARLGREGYEVVSAFDGDSCVEAARRERPDLIMIEWMMTRMSGLEAAKCIKSDPVLSHIPIVMVTYKGQESDRIIAHRAGVVRYVTKPFNIDRLVALVQEVLI